MKKYFLLLLICLCFSCTKKSPSSMHIIDKEISDSLSIQLDSLYQEDIFRGFAVAIVDTNGILYNKGFGFADFDAKKSYNSETLINIASISKEFIGIALMKAVELKLIKLDNNINDYLNFEVVNPHHPKAIITVRQLATHTSSIIDSDIYMETAYVRKDKGELKQPIIPKYETYYQNDMDQWLPLSDYLKKVLKKDEIWYRPESFWTDPPGKYYEYSNVGAALCALVIESAAKQSFDEFTQTHIFKPLKMNNTAWTHEAVDMDKHSKLYYDEVELPYYKILSYPDGGLITSSSDLALFLMELINGYIGKGVLLAKESYREIFTSQLHPDQLEGNTKFNVGLFQEKQLPYHVIGHSGGDPGTNTLMYFDTKQKTGRLMLLNGGSNKENAEDIYWGIWDALGAYQDKLRLIE